jgi:hypothetical protein
MPKVDFEEIRTKVQHGDYEISVHAFERMRQRGISLEDVESVIIDGTIIERDSDAKPFPKCIFWGFTALKGESLHVVCSLTPQSKIVTVYFPDEDQWARDRFRRR